MRTYVVERYLTGWNGDEIAALLARLDSLEPHFLTCGVEYVHSLVFDADETCLSVFYGPDAPRVRSANTAHGLRTDRVVGATLAAASHGTSA